jgi:murein DD-endopeptidase MepM/ murein hydrolase activator NlpD
MRSQQRYFKTICLLDVQGRTLFKICLPDQTLWLLIFCLLFSLSLALSNHKYNQLVMNSLQQATQTKMVNKIQKNALAGLETELGTIKERLLTIQKETTYLQGLISFDREATGTFANNEKTISDGKISIEKSLLGERIEKNSISMGDKTVMDFYEDTETNAKDVLSAEERALLAAKQLKQMLSYKLLPGKVTIKNMPDNVYLGLLGRHTLFRVDENDSKFLNLPPQSIAEEWAANINREVARMELNKKRLTMRQYISLPFAGTTTRLTKELNFLTQKVEEEKQRFINLAESTKKIELQYAYTPSEYPVQRPISSTFGLRRHPITHIMRFHTGVDFWAWPGTQVHATACGRVLQAGWYNGYGYTVIIYHGNGLATLYGHNSRILVSKGAWVNKGQVISLSGSSGLANGAHLHYEVRRWQNPVNPVAYLNLNVLTAAQFEGLSEDEQ